MRESALQPTAGRLVGCTLPCALPACERSRFPSVDNAIPAVAPKFHRNFGFMFSFVGRSLFIVFCGTMAFAMANWLGYVVGAGTLCEWTWTTCRDDVDTHPPATNIATFNDLPRPSFSSLVQ